MIPPQVARAGHNRQTLPVIFAQLLCLNRNETEDNVCGINNVVFSPIYYCGMKSMAYEEEV